MAQAFLDDYLDLEPFAAQAGRDPRTIRRWMDQKNGLPYTRIGNRLLIHLPTARDWLQSRMINRNPPKKTRNAK
jgi:hypothetical protein